jgi:hypothetical protein
MKPNQTNNAQLTGAYLSQLEGDANLPITPHPARASIGGAPKINVRTAHWKNRGLTKGWYARLHSLFDLGKSLRYGALEFLSTRQYQGLILIRANE